jgi:GYF domain 2
MVSVRYIGDSAMAGGYKVRIADGSEIGPMDLSAIRTWYAQGLIDRDSPVLKPGSKTWSTLGEVEELKGLGLGGGGGARSGSRAPAASTVSRSERSVPTEFDPDAWRIRAGGVLFLLGAAAMGLLALHPENAVADLDGAPWLEIALGSLVLALLLLPAWDFGRKGVRAVTALLAVGMFPVMGILFAQGVRGAGLFAVASAWLVASGFFAYLGPSLEWPRIALCLAPILAGAYGAFHFGYAPETSAQRAVRAAAIPDRRLADASLGLSFEVPRGWVILKKDNTLVKAPADARVVVAQPRTGGYGYLVAENSPRAIANLDQYLDRLLAERRKAVPSLKELGRSDAMVGPVSGRKSVGTWDDAGVKQRDMAVAWKDGWVYFGLVSWIPDEGTDPQKVLDGLVPAFSTQGVLAERLQQAVQRVTLEVPQLTAPAAEALMGQSAAKVLEPDQAFRRSIEALVRALPTLTKAETQELTEITSATYGTLAARDRGRLLAYMDRVRNGQSTTPQEDREMSSLTKMAVLKLPNARRLRLQALYAKAIAATVGA